MQTPLSDNPAYQFFRGRQSLVQRALDLARAGRESSYALVMVDPAGAAMFGGGMFEGVAVHTDGASVAIVPFAQLLEQLADTPEGEAVRARLESYVPGRLPPLLVVARGMFFFCGGDHVCGQA